MSMAAILVKEKIAVGVISIHFIDDANMGMNTVLLKLKKMKRQY